MQKKQLERYLIEVGFFCVLAIATAALHFKHGFHSAFAHFSVSGPPVEHSPLYNYIALITAAAAAYLAARGTAATISSALPATVKSNTAFRRAVLILLTPVAAYALYIVAGSPPISQHPVAKWLARNWERNAKNDLAWCARLFVLLGCWQALLGGAFMVVRGLAWGVMLIAPNGRGEELGDGEESNIVHDSVSEDTNWPGDGDAKEVEQSGIAFEGNANEIAVGTTTSSAVSLGSSN